MLATLFARLSNKLYKDLFNSMRNIAVQVNWAKMGFDLSLGIVFIYETLIAG